MMIFSQILHHICASSSKILQITSTYSSSFWVRNGKVLQKEINFSLIAFYSCFRPFMGHSLIITWLWYHIYKLLLPDSSQNSTFIQNNRLITPYSPRYSTRGWVIRPGSINFTVWLRLDLGHRLLVFASLTNLKLGPRFADFDSFQFLSIKF